MIVDGLSWRDIENELEAGSDPYPPDALDFYRLGSGGPTVVSELICLIRKVAARTELTAKCKDIRSGEVHATWCDITRAKRDLNFDPQTPLQDGLAQTWQWFQANWRP